MSDDATKDPLRAVTEADLTRLARAADTLLAGRPNLMEGPIHWKRRPGRGMEFFDFQRYEPGSDIRTIDWRASARGRQKMMRRYHQDMSSEWYVCLDRSASMGVPDSGKWSLAVQLAVAFVFLLLHRTDRVGFLAFSSDVDVLCPPGRGHAQFKRAVSSMSGERCRSEGGRSNLAACVGRIGWRRSAFVISDFLAPDAMRPALGALSRLGGALHAVQVLSAGECEPPASDYALLQDIESGDRLMIEAGANARAGARDSAEDNLVALQSELSAYCRRNGVGFTACTTAQPWQAAVLQHLRQVSGRHA